MEDIHARIHLAGGTTLASVDAVLAQAKWAEEAGLDGFWVSQIFGVDPFVALAAVAHKVPHVPELGTSVVPLYGRHPLALAALALTAQSATGGRFTLGVGTSHQVFVEGVLGQSFDRPAALTQEYLQVLNNILVGDRAALDGTEVSVNGQLNIDAAPVPILLAALGPRMLDLAGRYADGTTLGQCGPRTIATHISPRVNEAAARAGRATPRIMALVDIAVTSDIAAAREQSARHAAGYASLPSYRRVLDLEGVESGADLLVAGSPDQVTEGLAAYVAAGVTDLRIGISTFDPDVEQATRAFLSRTT